MESEKSKHHQVVVIGGGTGGIMVSAQLLKAKNGLDLAIIEPSEEHHYQPAWTLVGAGLMKKSETVRAEKKQIPRKATWIKEYVEDIDPDAMEVKLRNGDTVSYEYLIVAPGIQINLDGIEGLKEAYGKGDVCSNYIDPEYTWKTVQNFKGGVALFTQPLTPIKCPGAPQKIMYLASEYFRNKKVPDTHVAFVTPGTVLFGTEPFRTELQHWISKYDVSRRYGYKLVKVDGELKEAHYVRLALPNGRTDHVINDERNAAGCTGFVWEKGARYIVEEENNHVDELKEGTHFVIKYDMLHLAPPQSAPTWFQKTKLANQEGPNAGWMGVDKHTLQSVYYKNVFGAGDITDVPTARTGAAIRKQAPTIVENLLKIMDGKEADYEGYDGYSSCPLVVSHNRMLLAEFKYDNVRSSDPLLSKFIDTGKASYAMWLMKRYGLPMLYWNAMLKGYKF
jgi:sulfide:quinone oxidoreductase